MEIEAGAGMEEAGKEAEGAVMIYAYALDRLRNGIMRMPRIEAVLRLAKSKLWGDPNAFLRRASGVIHVGAKVGKREHSTRDTLCVSFGSSQSPKSSRR